MTNVHEYFLSLIVLDPEQPGIYRGLIDAFAEACAEISRTSDAPSLGDILKEMPLDSNCGDDCKVCIDHAIGLINSIVMGYGTHKPDLLYNTFYAAVRTCVVYIRG